MFKVNTAALGEYDVAVCGGGIAGVCAAVSAARAGARTVLIEKAGSLGGTLTEGFMPLLLDAKNKGGLVKELFDFLNAHGLTCERHSPVLGEDGRKRSGFMVDTEGCKYFFDKICTEAGVTLLFHTTVAAAELDGRRLKRILLASECGNYSLTAKVFIDATGGGYLSALAGCEWECGDPVNAIPSPASMEVCVVGMPKEYDGTETAEDKTEYGKMLKAHGIEISSEQASVRKLPNLSTWTMGLSFGYGVRPNDIHALTKATVDGRREIFEVIEKHREIPGYEELYTAFTSSHIGLREGRRIYGEYRITDEDILEGRRFEDGICLVTFGVDVHKLEKNDTTDCRRGYKTKPYGIPYRALVARDADNLLLAGRCISGDFYPHASYRVMGNMAASGEAAGFAAALCAAENALPRTLDGKRIRLFMEKKGYEI